MNDSNIFLLNNEAVVPDGFEEIIVFVSCGAEA
jgi:hypothetical protein